MQCFKSWGKVRPCMVGVGILIFILVTLFEGNAAIYQVGGLYIRRGYDPEDLVYKEARSTFRVVVSNDCWRIDIFSSKSAGGVTISTDGRFFYHANSPSPKEIQEGKSGFADRHIGTVPLPNQLDRGRVILFYVYASAGLFGGTGQPQLMPLELVGNDQLPAIKYKFQIGSNSLPDFIETTFEYMNKSTKTNRLEVLERERIGDYYLPKRSLVTYRLTNANGTEWLGGPYDTFEIIATNMTLKIDPVSFIPALRGMHSMVDRTLRVSNTTHALGHSRATNWFSTNELIQMYHEMKEQQKLKQMTQTRKFKMSYYAWFIMFFVLVSPAVLSVYIKIKIRQKGDKSNESIKS